MMWTKISIDTSCEAVDLLSAFLDEKGVEGIMIEDNVPLTDEDKEAMFVDIPLITGEDDGTARVSCFVTSEQTDDPASAENVSFDIESLKADIAAELIRLKEFIPVGTMNIETSVTEDTDWMNNWKKFFKPFRLYDNIVIKPTWEEYNDKNTDDIVVEIDPGIAFGTGSHETTKLCIGQLKKYLKSGDSVFDVGSGSGILSIISSLLGAGFVHGMDIDAVAERAGKENAKLNHIEDDKLVFTCGNLLGENVIGKDDSYSLTGAYKKQPDISDNPYLNRKYDIVVANILAEVIIPLSAVIGQYIEKDGYYITSGIINEKEEAVKQALLSNGFKIIDTLYMGEWVSIVATPA
ncbi:MAG: 50S ribosomal protein L11 methyltransferase [Lachnospiraceae bacterium]|nr:50S ribosomal protein L11 methyltransferase [Lachnospiraceae bacterium]